MKHFIFSAFWFFLLQACSSIQQESAVILGTYVRQFNSEFGEGWDTVVIEAQRGVMNGYVIKHHIKTIRKGGDQISIPVQKELVLPSTWKDKEKALITSRFGRKYTFPQKGTLMLGTAKYEQI